MAESLPERARIHQIVTRDGVAQARAWARRTEALYRTAVLDPAHFAHTAEYRRRFIEAYLTLKRFASQGLDFQGDGPLGAEDQRPAARRLGGLRSEQPQRDQSRGAPHV